MLYHRICLLAVDDDKNSTIDVNNNADEPDGLHESSEDEDDEDDEDDDDDDDDDVNIY